MKYILFLFTFILIACETYDNCPWEINKEFIRIVDYADIDTIISGEQFSLFSDYKAKHGHYETNYKDLGTNPIAVSVISKGDTLNYILEIKNQENIIILVDTSNTPCASNSILYKRDYDHYRVDAEKIHSCVFYQKQECY